MFLQKDKNQSKIDVKTTKLTNFALTNFDKRSESMDHRIEIELTKLFNIVAKKNSITKITTVTQKINFHHWCYRRMGNVQVVLLINSEEECCTLDNVLGRSHRWEEFVTFETDMELAGDDVKNDGASAKNLCIDFFRLENVIQSISRQCRRSEDE